MAKLRMTKQEQEAEQEAVEKAREAKESMSDEEREAEVSKTVEGMASDVTKKATKKTNERPKKKTANKKAPTPAREAASRKDDSKRDDPLQGVTVDPEENYPKILNMVISVGAEDERSMEEFIKDAKEALTSHADAKVATVLLSKVMIDGKHISSHHYEDELKRLQPEENEDG